MALPLPPPQSNVKPGSPEWLAWYSSVMEQSAGGGGVAKVSTVGQVSPPPNLTGYTPYTPGVPLGEGQTIIPGPGGTPIIIGKGINLPEEPTTPPPPQTVTPSPETTALVQELMQAPVSHGKPLTEQEALGAILHYMAAQEAGADPWRGNAAFGRTKGIYDILLKGLPGKAYEDLRDYVALVVPTFTGKEKIVLVKEENADAYIEEYNAMLARWGESRAAAQTKWERENKAFFDANPDIYDAYRVGKRRANTTISTRW